MTLRRVKFYVATGLNNAGNQQLVVNEMRKHFDWECSYDWSVHGSVQNDGPDMWRKVASNETQGVREADVVIVLLPGFRGTHTELGMAIALDKPIVIVGPREDETGRTCVFYHGHRLAHTKFNYSTGFDGLVHVPTWLLDAQLDGEGHLTSDCLSSISEAAFQAQSGIAQVPHDLSVHP